MRFHPAFISAMSRGNWKAFVGELGSLGGRGAGSQGLPPRGCFPTGRTAVTTPAVTRQLPSPPVPLKSASLLSTELPGPRGGQRALPPCSAPRTPHPTHTGPTGTPIAHSASLWVLPSNLRSHFMPQDGDTQVIREGRHLLFKTAGHVVGKRAVPGTKSRMTLPPSSHQRALAANWHCP